MEMLVGPAGAEEASPSEGATEDVGEGEVHAGAGSEDGSLEGMTVGQLRDLCKERGIRGYTKMRKAELLEVLGAQ